MSSSESESENGVNWMPLTHFAFPQVSWSSEFSSPPCWTPENSGRPSITTAAPWAWNTACASAATPTTSAPFATNSAEPETTFSVTLTATRAAPRFAWRDGRDRSAKKVTDTTCWINIQVHVLFVGLFLTNFHSIITWQNYNFILSEESRFAELPLLCRSVAAIPSYPKCQDQVILYLLHRHESLVIFFVWLLRSLVCFSQNVKQFNTVSAKYLSVLWLSREKMQLYPPTAEM